jgi:AMIN domain
VQIRSIDVTPRGAEMVVTISADGPLPPPPIGVLDDPPRIYMDFAGVRAGSPAFTRARDPRIHRIRIAQHSINPMVTRVVIDLTSAQPHYVELEPTRIRLAIGSSGPATAVGPGLQPLPPLREPAPAQKEAGTFPGKEAGTLNTMREPMPPGTGRRGAKPTPDLPAVSAVPAEQSPRPPPRLVPGPSLEPPPLKEVAKYHRMVATFLDRLRLQQPILASLDAQEDQSAERMQMAVDEFERIRQELTAVKPPDALKAHHDMLVQASTMAVLGAKLRLQASRSPDPGSVRNAASAAAGAILLLDRACVDLGC